MSTAKHYRGACFVVLGLLLLVFFLNNGKKESFEHEENSEQNEGRSRIQPPSSCSSKCSQEDRLRQLREKCKKYPELQRPPNEIPYERLMVDDKHKVIYCQLSKAGSTSFINLLYYAVTGISGTNNHYAPIRSKVGLVWLDEFPEDEQARKLRDYYKILAVRHPFDRLESCYNGKFTHPKREVTWTDHGPAMIDMFRKPSDGGNMEQEYLKGATWEEFVKYVSYLEDQSPEKHNHHWNKIINECFPCSIDYDIVVKTETLVYDVAPILSRLNVTEFPSINIRRHDIQTNEPLAESVNKKLGNYARLAPHLIQSLHKMYEVNMDLFGYSFNTSKMVASCGSSNCKSPSCC